ncbi:MAG TPA: hypothetical protein VHI93_08610, partial [Candidatus Thermoplasmatota archaeon]|nr:hypothetical protein [Candidatus Thermoplasmatota archaeon]
MPSKGPDRPKGSAFDDILHEERDHAAKQVQAAKEGDVAAVAEHERVHQERQAETAKVLLDYEHILDAALTHLRVKDLLEE